jgi:Leucine-rich repeat (LRR) protein
MIEKKSLINTIKRALQTGSFQMIGQELKMFPIEVCRIDTLNFEDQNWWDCNPITKMDLSNNNIQDIPAEIAKLPDLQLIRLKNNEVRELPLAVFELVGLKSLDLAKNKVSSLPLDIQRAGSLV